MALQSNKFVLPPPPNPDADINDYSWRDWFRQLRDYIVHAGVILWSQLDFTGSKLTDIQNRPHNVLQSMQGGNSTLDEFYHFTENQHTNLTDGGETNLHYHASDRDLANATGVLAVNKGGTGQTSLTSGYILAGNDTNPINVIAYGSSGNVLKSNGSAWVSGALTSTDLATPLSTWTGSSSITTVGTISSGTWSGTTISANKGGTGQTSYTDGQLLIGNSTGNTLTKATLTAGSGITITNGSGSITIESTASLLGKQENQTASSGQTVFTLTTMTYVPGSNTLSVFIDGVNQQLGTAFTETNTTTITFSSGLHVGAKVRFAVN